MTDSLFKFRLSERQVMAILSIIDGVDGAAGLPKRHPLLSAATALDEQMGNQQRPWERCPNCKGSGWVE